MVLLSASIWRGQARRSGLEADPTPMRYARRRTTPSDEMETGDDGRVHVRIVHGRIMHMRAVHAPTPPATWEGMHRTCMIWA